MSNNLDEIYEVLKQYIDPEMASYMKAISDGSIREEYMMLPDDRDLTPSEVSRLIALASNKYSNACKLASLARARAKAAEGRYKYKYKISLGAGKNQDEREANAMAAAEAEYQERLYADMLVDICEGIEGACRIASESSRKMMQGSEQTVRAENRFNDNAGSLGPRDFQGW